MSSKRAARIALAVGMVLVNTAWAEPESLKSIAQRAILNNPEVQQKWHAYGAADHERDVAFGAYLPRVDLTAGTGREYRNDPILRKDFERTSASLTLTQMIYDGFATRNEVRRLDHARTVRYFELLEISENTALEAGRAYFDVLRYRSLVALAEENYIRHKVLFDQVQEKSNAGVARRVDLEQATGRLALASANLLTETSNLHDVNARFQRIVGDLPPADIKKPAQSLASTLPAKTSELLEYVQVGNPTVLASIENVRAARASSEIRKAAYQPRFDIRLRNERGMDLNGYTGETNNRTAEVLMTWNLFNGLSDIARSRQYVEQFHVAQDVRDKTCRDIRQTALIAYNDGKKLQDQLVFLDQHRTSIGKAREAYRRQFEIGQRTLLDLLDTENEYFQSRRAYVNAEFDLEIAYLRTHAGTGNVLRALELTRMAKNELPDIEGWKAETDAADRCPNESPEIYRFNKEVLDVKAVEVMRQAAELRAAEIAQVTAAAAQAAATKPPVELSRNDPQQPVLNSLRDWERAWSEKKVDDYVATYAPSFIKSHPANWADERKRIISSAKSINLSLSNVKVTMKGSDAAVVSFKQEYQSENSRGAVGYRDIVNKTMEWSLIGNKWMIVSETFTPIRSTK